MTQFNTTHQCQTILILNHTTAEKVIRNPSLNIRRWSNMVRGDQIYPHEFLGLDHPWPCLITSNLDINCRIHCMMVIIVKAEKWQLVYHGTYFLLFTVASLDNGQHFDHNNVYRVKCSTKEMCNLLFSREKQ